VTACGALSTSTTIVFDPPVLLHTLTIAGALAGGLVARLDERRRREKAATLAGFRAS
jgi:hypothetical protein